MENPIENKGFLFTKESLKKKFRWSEFLSEKIITGVGFLSITIIVLIFFFVFKEALPIFHSKKTEVAKIETVQKQEQYGGEANKSQTNSSGQEQYGVTTNDTMMIENQARVDDTIVHGSDEATFKSLTGKQWLPVSDNPRYGLIPLFVGTLKITLIAMLFAAPIAILAALFSASFAPYWMREILKPAIELLAGFPSVVIGFFALMVMASFFQNIFGYDGRLNAFVGGVAMALAAIPIIFTSPKMRLPRCRVLIPKPAWRWGQPGGKQLCL